LSVVITVFLKRYNEYEYEYEYSYLYEYCVTVLYRCYHPVQFISHQLKRPSILPVILTSGFIGRNGQDRLPIPLLYGISTVLMVS